MDEVMLPEEPNLTPKQWVQLSMALHIVTREMAQAWGAEPDEVRGAIVALLVKEMDDSLPEPSAM